MDNVTIGQIIAIITSITIIASFFIGIFKWFKGTISDRFTSIECRLTIVETASNKQDKEIHSNKEEMFVIINGLLACLKGLHDDLECNGPVTKGIKDIEDYLINKSHE